MSLETYWMAVPLVGICLCVAAGIGMWVTRPNRKAAHEATSQMALPL
jgi:hypothetical protein